MRKRTKLPPDTGGDTSALLDEPMLVEHCEAKTYAEYLGPGRAPEQARGEAGAGRWCP